MILLVSQFGIDFKWDDEARSTEESRSVFECPLPFLRIKVVKWTSGGLWLIAIAAGPVACSLCFRLSSHTNK